MICDGLLRSTYWMDIMKQMPTEVMVRKCQVAFAKTKIDLRFPFPKILARCDRWIRTLTLDGTPLSRE